MKGFFKVIALLIVLIILLEVLGIDVPFISDLPLFGKPEDPIKNLMSQESLMGYLSYFEDNNSEFADKESENYSILLFELFNSPGLKSFLLDNIHTMNYNITNVSENGDTATVILTIFPLNGLNRQYMV